MRTTLLQGDCVERMRELDADSIDAVVCDPPYGLEFMGKEWDRLAPSDRARMDGERSYRVGERGGAYERAGVKYVVAGREMQDWHEAWAREALRVLKPGGHLLAFGGTRTYHRLAAAVEDAGFEIRDQIAWMYGSGFPKSLDVAKAIDRTLGAAGEYAGVRPGHADFVERDDAFAAGGRSEGWSRPWQDDPEARERHHLAYEPATEQARGRRGWGTALKPAYEPVVVARKPFPGTVAANVLAYGVAGINVDACRIGTSKDVPASPSQTDSELTYGSYGVGEGRLGSGFDAGVGRWPANVVLGHSPDCVPVGTREVASDGHFPSARPGGVEVGTVGHAGQDGLEERHTRGETVDVWDCVGDCPVRLLDEQTGELRSGTGAVKRATSGGWQGSAYGAESRSAGTPNIEYGDAGGASRFFYTAKTSRAERNAGLDGFDATVEVRTPMAGRGQGGLRCRACRKWKASGSPCRCANPDFERVAFDSPPSRNQHPTVKPIDLMRWLLRLVVPPGGTILDPFLGSGSTGCAAALEGLDFVGVELDPDYLRIAEARIAFWREYGEDGLRVVADRAAGERVRAERAATGQLDLLSG